MKRSQLALLCLCLAALPVAAQQVKPVEGTPPGKGSGYRGPGDTVPDPGSGPPPSNPTRPRQPPAVPTGPSSPTYPAVANPLSPSSLAGITATPSAPSTPASRPSVEIPDSWQFWWHYNRWAHLDAGIAISSSDTGGFYLGRGEKADPSPRLHASPAQIRDIAQPSLIRALDHGGTKELEIYALQAWAKLRKVPADEELGSFESKLPRFLTSGDEFISEKAVLSLGVRGEERFVPWLADILGDTPEGRSLVGRSTIGYRTRAFAAYGLGLIGERTKDPIVRAAIYDTLVRALWVERPEVQAAACLALGMARLPTSGEYVAGGGDYFEGRTLTDQVLELVQFFEDDEQSFVARSQAPPALARLLRGAAESLRWRVARSMLDALTHSKEMREVQAAAVIALGVLGNAGGSELDSEILRELERVALRSAADPSIRHFALIALAEAGSRPGEGETPFAALDATRKTLLAHLLRSRGSTQAWTALALGLLEEDAAERGMAPAPESGKALRSVFEHSRSAEVAGAIAIALGLLEDREAEPLLVERMQTAGEEQVRAYSALGLGLIGGPNSIGPIRSLLLASRQQAFVIENAAIALSLLGDQQIGSELFELLRDAASPKVQASVASALGWIQDPRPLSRLCDHLLDTRKSDIGRAWTAVAIGRICDDDDDHWIGRLSSNIPYDVELPTLIDVEFQAGLLDLP
jgi:HEAT repeat protein